MLSYGKVLVLACVVTLQTACGDGFVFQRDILRNKKETKKKDGVCEAQTVQKLALPRDYADASLGTFDYAFEYVPAEAGKPTVVYIPGGPGQAAIGELSDWVERVPAGYGLVLTDPRGVGCNFVAPEGLKISFFQSEYVARDVLSAAQQLNLDNYMIYGISYGTVVATMAGSIAERDAGWPKPKAVVLEGVLGRGFNSAAEADQKYEDLWQRDMAKLALDKGAAKAELFKASTLPLGRTADEWLGVLRSTMMYGSLVDKNGTKMDVTYEIMARAVSDNATERDWAETIFASMNEDDGSFVEGSDTFYAYIACSEVFPDLRAMAFTNGEFVRTGGNLCTDNEIAKTAPLFQASTWPITAPIYYFEGEQDPATPATLARSEHFEKQTGSKARQFLLVKEAGHNPFGINMEDCKDAVWGAIATVGDFKAAVNTCEWATMAGFEFQTATTPAASDPATTTENPEATALRTRVPALHLRSYLPKP